MSILTPWVLRAAGVSGIAGAMLFVAGDLLYNDVPGSAEAPAVKMSRMPAARLINAGQLGYVGCWLYTWATLHVALAFRPAGDAFALGLALAFAATMVGYGVTHTAYLAIAAGAHVADELGADAEAGGALGLAFSQRLVTITYAPAAVGTLMMLYGIVSGRSLYPRWMVAALPMVLYLLKAPVARLLRGRARDLVGGSYDNLVLFVFYTLSTLVLWHAPIT